MLFISFRTDSAWYRLMTPAPTYAPWCAPALPPQPPPPSLLPAARACPATRSLSRPPAPLRRYDPVVKSARVAVSILTMLAEETRAARLGLEQARSPLRPPPPPPPPRPRFPLFAPRRLLHTGESRRPE